MEATQFTYFQQAGGIDLDPISVELTYGLERVAMYLQGKNSVFDLEWVPGVTYGEVHHQDEVELSTYNFEVADVPLHLDLFNRFEAESLRALERGLVLPAYDYTLKCSHAFNVLDARGAISVAERQKYIGRVRNLARRCAEGYVATRERLGYPMLKEGRKA
jgi:glycyl-tRNA synthetase alpha chain